MQVHKLVRDGAEERLNTNGNFSCTSDLSFTCTRPQGG
jgi:hypothetical protein